MTALREMTNLILKNGILSSVINKFPKTRSQFNFFYFLHNITQFSFCTTSSLPSLVVTSLPSKHSNTKLADNAKSRRTASYMYRVTINKNSETSGAQWNGTFQLQRLDPSHRAFFYCGLAADSKLHSKREE